MGHVLEGLMLMLDAQRCMCSAKAPFFRKDLSHFGHFKSGSIVDNLAVGPGRALCVFQSVSSGIRIHLVPVKLRKHVALLEVVL